MMRNIRYILFVALILVTATGCEKIFMAPNPGTSNIDILNEYAKLVKEKFAMLEYKGVDIDHLRDSIAATITDNMTEDELFAALTTITYKLHDGHSDLTYGDSTFYYPFYKDGESAIDREILENNYLGEDVAPDIIWLEGSEEGVYKAIYGHMPQADDIGFIRIGTWMEELSDEEIEKIFETFKNDKGLIFDVRDNPGGDPTLSTKFASYFTDKEIYLGEEYFKTGPGPDDFKGSKQYLRPANSDNLFLDKPVMVLTDIWCFSATTTFMFSLNPLDNVKFVGQRSGGGAGSVADGFLANGWHWDLSVSEFIDLNGNHWDNGWKPDITVSLDTTDKSKDEVVERALYEIRKLTASPK